MDAYIRGPELGLDAVWVKVHVVCYHEPAQEQKSRNTKHQ